MKTEHLYGIIAMIAIGVVGLYTAFVFDNSPTGYAALQSIDCDGFNDKETCSSYTSCGVREGEGGEFFCLNIGPCEQGNSCDPTKLTGQDNGCGGRFGLNDPDAGICQGEGNSGSCSCPCQAGECDPRDSGACGGNPSNCISLDPGGNVAICDCDGDREEVEGRSCFTTEQFGSVSGIFQPCGDGCFCDPVGFGPGSITPSFIPGICRCDQRECDFTPDGGFDECVPSKLLPSDGNVCEEDFNCYGGICDNGICRSVDEFGCTPDQCRVGQPCLGEGADDLACGGVPDNCDAEGVGVCESCGKDCEFTQFSGEGPVDCNDLEAQLQAGSCGDQIFPTSFIVKCECTGVTQKDCESCFNLEGGQICGEE